MIVALALMLAAMQDAPRPQDDVSVLSDITVVASPLTRLLTVDVTGNADQTTLVTAEHDLRCGPVRFQWEAFGRPRQCWIRRKAGHSVVLTVTGRASHQVLWSGCTQVRHDGACEVMLNEDTAVSAVLAER